MEADWYTNKQRKTKGQTTPLRIIRNNKNTLAGMILLISLINILLMLAQIWPAKLNVAMKVHTVYLVNSNQ